MGEVQQSNYEKVLEMWRQNFLRMDHESLIKKFQLEADEENLYLVYFNKKLKINRITGKIFYMEDPERKPGFDTSITIYNMFHYACEVPAESGKLVPFREVKRVYPFEAAYKRTILKRFSETFSGHVKELSEACEALGGKKLPQGDAGYVIPVFPFLHIAVLFWDGDDEFEAQGNMLFDSNITDFFSRGKCSMCSSRCCVLSYISGRNGRRGNLCRIFTGGRFSL